MITEQTWAEEDKDNDRLKQLYSEIDDELDKCYLDLPFRMLNDIRNYMWGVMFAKKVEENKKRNLTKPGFTRLGDSESLYSKWGG